MTLVHVVVEGKTEESFVDSVLAPGFWRYNVELRPKLLGRGRDGGRVSYERVRKDVEICLKKRDGSYCTTFVDFYGRAKGWPDVPANLPNLNKALSLEDALRSDFKEHFDDLWPGKWFIPYIQLHEFEGLLFSDPPALARSIRRPDLASKLQAIRDEVATPKDIDDGPETAPSKRLLKLYPGYRKVSDGTAAAQAVGLEAMRRDCPHFRDWLQRLQAIGAS
ncbi:MAG: DUF4276 family protein [Bryobacteraceae bacterium]